MRKHYDKYRDWPLPGQNRGIPAPRPLGMPMPTIEEKVLQDLAEAENTEDKIDILDSFGAYKQRDYRHDIIKEIARGLTDTIQEGIMAMLEGRLQEVMVPMRRVVAKGNTFIEKEKSKDAEG